MRWIQKLQRLIQYGRNLITHVEVNYKDGEKVYGVYYNFESDVNGEFDVLAWYETLNDKLDTVKI